MLKQLQKLQDNKKLKNEKQRQKAKKQDKDLPVKISETTISRDGEVKIKFNQPLVVPDFSVLISQTNGRSLTTDFSKININNLIDINLVISDQNEQTSNL